MIEKESTGMKERKKMKANRLYGIKDLRFEEVDMPELKEDEVLVKVKACGICGSDVNRYFTSGTYHYPTIIGHEFSGVVAGVQNKEDEPLIGQRVGVFPLKPCFSCDQCKKGNYELCSHYDYLGSRCDGGFAEYVAVPKWNLIKLPEKVTFKEGAMLEPASVALHVLKRLDDLEGENVLITGPGPIGIILAKLAKIKGAAKVILVGRSDDKLTFAKQHGIEYTLNSNDGEFESKLNAITEGKGFKFGLEGTGASSCIEMILDRINAEGSVVLYGNPHGDIAIRKDSYWKILRKQLILRGTWNSSFGGEKNDWKEILDLIDRGQLKISDLITHTLPLEGLLEGLQKMNDTDCFTCKVMITEDD